MTKLHTPEGEKFHENLWSHPSLIVAKIESIRRPIIYVKCILIGFIYQTVQFTNKEFTAKTA